MNVPNEIKTDPNVVWSAILDDKYVCRVIRIDRNTGRLLVSQNDDTVILNTVVSLAYGAMFGPDIDDIMKWEDAGIKAVDAFVA